MMFKSFKKILGILAFCFTLSSCSVFQVFNIKYVATKDEMSSYAHPNFVFDNPTLNLRVGDSKKLEITYTMSWAPNDVQVFEFGAKSWKSSDTKVATVSSKGVVTAKAAGGAKIEAKLSDEVTVGCWLLVVDGKIPLSELFERYASPETDDKQYIDWLTFKKTASKDNKTYTYYLRYKEGETKPYVFDAKLEDANKPVTNYTATIKFDSSGFTNGVFNGTVSSSAQAILSSFYFDNSKINFNTKKQTISIDKKDVPMEDDGSFTLFGAAYPATADQRYTTFILMQDLVAFYNDTIKEHNTTYLKLL